MSACPACGSPAEARADGALRCIGTGLDLPADVVRDFYLAAGRAALLEPRRDTRSVDEVLDSVMADLDRAGAA